MEGHVGIEPTSLGWKPRIIANIPMPHLAYTVGVAPNPSSYTTYSELGLCTIGEHHQFYRKSFNLSLMLFRYISILR